MCLVRQLFPRPLLTSPCLYTFREGRDVLGLKLLNIRSLNKTCTLSRDYIKIPQRIGKSVLFNFLAPELFFLNFSTSCI